MPRGGLASLYVSRQDDFLEFFIKCRSHRCGKPLARQDFSQLISCGESSPIYSRCYPCVDAILPRPGPPKTTSGASSTYFVPWEVMLL
jgi:hypothetical protein